MARQTGHYEDDKGRVHITDAKRGHPDDVHTFTENQIGRAAKAAGKGIIRALGSRKK